MSKVPLGWPVCGPYGRLFEGVHHPDPVVVLAVVEVLTEKFPTAGGLGCGEDSGIPIGDLVAIFEEECRLEGRDGIFLDGKAEPFLDQTGGEVVRQCIRATQVRGLHVELLKHLYGKDQIGAGQNFCRNRGFRRLCAIEVERIKQDVGVNEWHGGRAVPRGLDGKQG